MFHLASKMKELCRFCCLMLFLDLHGAEWSEFASEISSTQNIVRNHTCVQTSTPSHPHEHKSALTYMHARIQLKICTSIKFCWRDPIGSSYLTLQVHLLCPTLLRMSSFQSLLHMHAREMHQHTHSHTHKYMFTPGTPRPAPAQASDSKDPFGISTAHSQSPFPFSKSPSAGYAELWTSLCQLRAHA